MAVGTVLTGIVVGWCLVRRSFFFLWRGVGHVTAGQPLGSTVDNGGTWPRLMGVNIGNFWSDFRISLLNCKFEHINAILVFSHFIALNSGDYHHIKYCIPLHLFIGWVLYYLLTESGLFDRRPNSQGILSFLLYSFGKIVDP